jgi:AcrR family transcriptional regulator
MCPEIDQTVGETSATGPSLRKAEIVQAAIELFDERGYHGTRMQDIASRLGIQAPSLYNHVESKQQILRELMLSEIGSLLDEHRIALRSTNDVAEQLRRVMEAHVRHCARHRPQTRIANREVHSLDEPARGDVLAMRTELSSQWTRVIEQGVAEGRFDVESPQLAAYSLLQMGVGVAMWVRPPAIPESQLVYALGDAALRVVGATAKQP